MLGEHLKEMCFLAWRAGVLSTFLHVNPDLHTTAVPLISLIAGNRYCHPWPANGRAMVDTTPISRRRDRGRENAQKFSSGLRPIFNTSRVGMF